MNPMTRLLAHSTLRHHLLLLLLSFKPRRPPFQTRGPARSLQRPRHNLTNIVTVRSWLALVPVLHLNIHVVKGT